MPKPQLPSIEYSHPFTPTSPQFSLLLRIYDVMKYSYLVWNAEVAVEEKQKTSKDGDIAKGVSMHVKLMNQTLTSLQEADESFMALFGRMPVAFRLSLPCQTCTEAQIRQFIDACLKNTDVDYISFVIMDRKYIRVLRTILNEMSEDLGEMRIILTVDTSRLPASKLRLFTYYHDFHGFTSSNVHFEFLYPQLEEHAVLYRELFSRCDMMPKDLILWSNGTLNWQKTLSPEERSCKLSTLLHQKNHQPRPLLSGRLLRAQQEKHQKRTEELFAEESFVPVFGGQEDEDVQMGDVSEITSKTTTTKGPSNQKKRPLEQERKDAPKQPPKKKARLNEKKRSKSKR